VSPLFGRRRGGQVDPAQEQEQARRDAESLARLEQGRIPLAAAERLAAMASAQPGEPRAFSSDLSVAEFALLHRLGMSPITLVMGSSIYHVGWQNVYFNAPTEFETVSHAYNEARRLALGRLLEEAETAGADAVVGVRIQQGGHDWAVGAVEFVAVGTAVRLPPALRGDAGPVLTDLDGQQFWQLYASGIRPVGIVAQTSVHYQPAGPQTIQVMSGVFGSSWRNQELHDYTQGVYSARSKAIGGVRQQAQALAADGIVGVQMTQHMRGHRVQQFGGMDREDLIVTLHVIGTAVREDPSLPRDAAPPKTVVSLGTPLEPATPLRAASAGYLDPRKGPTPPWPMTRRAPRAFPRPGVSDCSRTRPGCSPATCRSTSSCSCARPASSRWAW
jgi:uncharacterized protein YbjQ (UPF0145 family)